MNELQQIISAEIETEGPLSWARFMELALYHKVHGYYEKRSDQVGTAGDFITSVSVGDLFGRLLAHNFTEWIKELRESGLKPPFQIVEAGAHTGQLAHDVLTGLHFAAPELAADVHYLIIEPSDQRSQWQRETLAEFDVQVVWYRSWAETPPIHGVIFSNELLDAFPVHRYVRNPDGWHEQAVETADGELGWTTVPADCPLSLPAELTAHLPDEYIHEHSPAASDWWTEASKALKRGWLLTCDYGATQDELLTRTTGTLRAYRNHAHAENPLADPGDQDLTAHVNWSAIQQTGEKTGLHTEALISQARFLTQILAQAASAIPDQWQLAGKQIRQFQMLTHPEHLGRKFQVLIQSRSV